MQYPDAKEEEQKSKQPRKVTKKPNQKAVNEPKKKQKQMLICSLLLPHQELFHLLNQDMILSLAKYNAMHFVKKLIYFVDCKEVSVIIC